MSQKKPNGFVLFMLDWNQQKEERRRRPSDAFTDVPNDPEFFLHWKDLSEDHKIYYRSRSKSDASRSDSDNKSNFDELTSDLDSLKMKDLEFKVNMTEYITSLVSAAKEQNNIHQIQFFIVHANYYCSHVTDTGEREFYPAEIAIAECSLAKGITRMYHQIVNEKIEIGDTHSAKEYSEKTHNIPINSSTGKSNHTEIFDDICKFLKPGIKSESLPPLFTLFTKDDICRPVKSVLSKLCAANKVPKDYLLLYSFEDFFATVYNGLNDGEIKKDTFDQLVASSELYKETFLYKLGLECEFHMKLEKGIEHCSESILKKWFNVVHKHCCE